MAYSPDAGSLAHFLSTGISPSIYGSSSPCFICTHPMTDASQIFCGHTYCAFCIRGWATSGHRHCPMCHQSLHFEFDAATGDAKSEAAELKAMKKARAADMADAALKAAQESLAGVMAAVATVEAERKAEQESATTRPSSSSV
ncbi:hypothetical protein LTR85_004045 [Meristemomyces frigidus]|nr:hypothetical protein LTR85_004045 [Meristemomyces frigidus]